MCVSVCVVMCVIVIVCVCVCVCECVCVSVCVCVCVCVLNHRKLLNINCGVKVVNVFVGHKGIVSKYT